MHKILVATLLSATLLAGTADAAQQTPASPPAPQGRPTPPDPLLLADANRDGVVTRDEVTARLSAAFARVDADGDGKISPAEREAVREVLGGPGGPGAPGMDGPPPPPRGPEGRPGMRGRVGERMAARMDKDGDGMISLDEQKARALARFDRVDTNKDGKIDAAERKAMHDRMLAMRDRRGPRGPGGPGGHMPPPPPPPADASDS